MLWPEFCGGTYKALSPVIAADQAINVYPESRQIPGSPKQWSLYGTPGITTYATTFYGGRNRGWFTQDGRTFTVIGSTLYELNTVVSDPQDAIPADPALNLAIIGAPGAIHDDGFPVSFASNGLGGDQLAIVGGGQLVVLDLNSDVLSAPIALPFDDPVMITFIDGYGLINQANTPIVWFSGLEDFTSWDALDFFARSGTSDNIVGITVTRDRVWCLGSKTSTLFYNSGDVDTPFVPYPGTAMQTGLVSPWLMGLYNDVLFWVAVSATGHYRVVQAVDPTPQYVSTPPIDQFLSRAGDLSTGEMTIYEQDGHQFIAITCPNSPDAVQTYVYDMREQLWHARASWNTTTGVYERWRVSGATMAFGRIFVGDVSNGSVGILSLDTYQEYESTLRRERTAPYLVAENQWMFVDQFELGIQAGVGLATGQGSDPMVELSISRDGAQTWTSAGFGTLGAIGNYTARAIWRRLGRSRGDRFVVRVSQSDPVKCVWGPGAWMRISTGTGML